MTCIDRRFEDRGTALAFGFFVNRALLKDEDALHQMAAMFDELAETTRRIASGGQWIGRAHRRRWEIAMRALDRESLAEAEGRDA